MVVHYRDAAVTHYPGRAAVVEALRSGAFPFINPYASCGEPLAGNPNQAVLFPDTLVAAATPFPVGFGFHFALALLLGWIGARRWARAEGASRGAAACAATAFVLSGPFLSAWTFYNAGMALAAAAWVLAGAAKILARAGDPGSPGLDRAVRETAVAAALLALAGEPVVALLAGFLIAVRVAGSGRRAVRGGGAVAGSLALALLLAAPQIALTWQASRGSSRDLAPYGFASATSTSVHPLRALEQVLPFPFGLPDRMGEGGFDGHDLFQGNAPYLWTLHLGWVALILLALHAGWRRDGERAGLVAAAAGVVLSLGARLPGAAILYPVLSLGGRIRYPVKWWYAVALALVPALAAAADRALAGEPVTRLRRLAALAGTGVAAVAAVALAARGSGAWGWIAALSSAAAGVSVLVAPRGIAATRLAARIAIPAAIVALPLVDAVLDRPPASPPRVSGRIYERVLATAHSPELIAAEPSLTTREFFRRAPRELWATTGAAVGAGYAFDTDPDGSYSFWDRVTREALEPVPWAARATELRLAGVRTVVARGPLPPPYREERVLDTAHDVRLFTLDGAMPSVRRVSRVLEAPSFNAVVDLHRSPSFDPAADVVLAGKSAEERGRREAGRVEIVRESPDALDARTDGAVPAVIVWSRTYFPAWEAEVDGARVPTRIADGHLVGVEVAPGAHAVRIVWSRGPLRAGLALCAVGLLGLLALGRTPGEKATRSLPNAG